MLNALRKQAGSWIVKALLLLLVLSFAIWGIGDIFYGNPDEAAVATVGDSEITASELNGAFNRSLDNLQRQFGGQLTREQAIGIGLLQQTLQEQVGQRLVAIEARAMGITIDDETLRQLITANPDFQTAGQFDRLRFNQLIRTTGLGEEGYLEALRQELAGNNLTGSVSVGATLPDAAVERIYRYRNEERRGRFFKIADTDITDVGSPNDADLDKIYQEEEARFTAPEFRAISFVTLEPKDLLDEVEIPEEEIQAAYDERSSRYIKAEQRSVEQLLAQDEAVAEQAKRLVEEGQTFAEIQEMLQDDGISLTNLGYVTEAGMPAGLGDDAFAVNEGEVAGPVQSPFGYHLFMINEVEPEEVTPLAEVHDEIREELALVEAEDRLPELATQLDDELAAGSKVDEAAGAVGLTVQKIEATSRAGQDTSGETIEALAAWRGLVQTAFEAELDQPSLLEETDDGAYYVVQVDQIIEERLKDLAEVRDEAIQMWEDAQRRAGAKARAEQLLLQLQETASMDTLAASEGVTLETIEPIKRSADGTDIGLNRQAVQALFAADEGKTVDQVVEIPDGVVVLANEEIITKEPNDDQVGFDGLKRELQRQARADVLDQFGNALREKHSIAIDNAVLTRLIENDGNLGYGGTQTPRPQPFF